MERDGDIGILELDGEPIVEPAVLRSEDAGSGAARKYQDIMSWKPGAKAHIQIVLPLCDLP